MARRCGNPNLVRYKYSRLEQLLYFFLLSPRSVTRRKELRTNETGRDDIRVTSSSRGDRSYNRNREMRILSSFTMFEVEVYKYA